MSSSQKLCNICELVSCMFLLSTPHTQSHVTLGVCQAHATMHSHLFRLRWLVAVPEVCLLLEFFFLMWSFCMYAKESSHRPTRHVLI